MKITKLLTLTCAISLNVVFAHENTENDPSLPHLEGPYLGQIPLNRSIDKDNVDIYWVDAQIIETLRLK